MDTERQIKGLMDARTSGHYRSPSTERQAFTIGAANQSVTLKNPQSIRNATNTGRNIAYRMDGEAAMGTAEYFAAGQYLPLNVVEVGGTDAGSTAGAGVVVYGV